ncbi:MAG TPA: Smr/MutS family protein [Steroidobacteraceae bacterium]|nr:Smr/MutS family protein [Steroidobacteraceae bacterium]
MKRTPDEEASLFREAVRDVKRLPASERPSGRRKPAPRARFAKSSTRAVPADERRAAGPGDPLGFSRTGTPRALLRELRRGSLRAQDELDLHGLTAARAALALHDFLAEASARGLECVRIVHGKGLHSGPDGPVLRNLVEATLRQSGAVVAFASATRAAGGTGAVNVVLATR